LQLRNWKSYRRDSNGYPHIFHHAQYISVTGDIIRQLYLPCIDMADTKPEVVCNFGTGRAVDAIPTATPTISITPNSTKSLATSSNSYFYFIYKSRSSYNRELRGCFKIRKYAKFIRPLQKFTSVDVTSNMASAETCILTPKLHFYLVPTHSKNTFGFVSAISIYLPSNPKRTYHKLRPFQLVHLYR